MKDTTCIFCKLADGSIPASTVYEDKYLKAIMDVSPANKGHVIILPKTHAADVFELDDEFVSRVFLLAKKIAAALKQSLNCDGINILQNNGEAAGQTVFHFHVHVIPRFKNDSCNISWKQGNYEDGEAALLADKINSLLS